MNIALTTCTCALAFVAALSGCLDSGGPSAQATLGAPAPDHDDPAASTAPPPTGALRPPEARARAPLYGFNGTLVGSNPPGSTEGTSALPTPPALEEAFEVPEGSSRLEATASACGSGTFRLEVLDPSGAVAWSTGQVVEVGKDAAACPYVLLDEGRLFPDPPGPGTYRAVFHLAGRFDLRVEISALVPSPPGPETSPGGTARTRLGSATAERAGAPCLPHDHQRTDTRGNTTVIQVGGCVLASAAGVAHATRPIVNITVPPGLALVRAFFHLHGGEPIEVKLLPAHAEREESPVWEATADGEGGHDSTTWLEWAHPWPGAYELRARVLAPLAAGRGWSAFVELWSEPPPASPGP